MNKKKIIDKIYKCLRLAESCNPNEAAAAMRQARGLMNKYGISQELVDAAPVAEATVPGSSCYTPPFWLVALSDVVACAFGCRVYLARSLGRGSEFRFIGLDARAEIASYTFTVLHRRLREARRIFMRQLACDDDAYRTRQGDIFAQAWLYRVARYVAVFASDDEAGAAVDAYIQAHYGEIEEIEHAPEAPEVEDIHALNMGLREGQRIKLYKPVREADDLGVLAIESA